MQPRLRLFNGERPAESSTQPKVAVRLRDVLEPLRAALANDSTFLSDFGDDEIELSADLYDVLTCFQRHRHSA